MVRAVSGRCLSFIAFISLLTVGACKSRGGEEGGGSAAGNAAGSAGAKLVLTGAGDASKITVSDQPTKPLPVAIERYTVATDEHFKLVKLVELGPESPTELHGKLTLTIDPATLPANTIAAQLRAVGVGKFVAPEDLTLEADGNTVTISINHVAHVMVLAPLPELTLLGTPAKILVGTTRMMTQDACQEWLTPTSPGIAAIAKDPAKFAVAADGTITLDAKLETLPVDAEGELAKPDDVLRRGGGDGANSSIVLASLFLARGNLIALVSGYMTYPHEGKTYRGLWQWAYVLLDGKPYFVDAFDPGKPRLVPLAEATTLYKLEVGRYCMRNADGSPIDKKVFRSESPSTPSGAGSGATIQVTIPQ